MKYLRYGWALPATLLGLALATLALRRGRLRVVGGVFEAHGPWLQWALTHLVPLGGGAGAMTIGHVVIAQDEYALEVTRAHERVHVRQYERWGVFFLPAYFIASACAALRGGHYYVDNVFEREARDGAIPSYCTSGILCSRDMHVSDASSTRVAAMNRSPTPRRRNRIAAPCQE